MSHPRQDEIYGLAAAANVAFWSFLSERFLGRAWPGMAASVVAMTRATSGCSGPVVELFNLPGSVTAQVLNQGTPCCASCAVGAPCESECKDHKDQEASK